MVGEIFYFGLDDFGYLGCCGNYVFYGYFEVFDYCEVCGCFGVGKSLVFVVVW